jgi:hypothetical protein
VHTLTLNPEKRPLEQAIIADKIEFELTKNSTEIDYFNSKLEKLEKK